MKRNNKKYALKEMSKVKIMHKHSEKSIIEEKELLSKLKHPFLVNMLCTFQDYDNLYILMDLLTGGDLRYHFNEKKKFSENEVKFFASCIILGVEYIHENKIVHRDLKPDNLVLDKKGYLRITDFGVAKIIKDKKCLDNSGTPGYLAPEIHFSQGHTFNADFYSIGVICYELLLGKRPYLGSDRKEIKKLMSNKEIFIEKNSNNLSLECIEFVNGCLKHKESERLGYEHGIKDLKNHLWFFDCDWEKLLKKELVANFIPEKEDNYDKRYCESNEKISNETLERYKLYTKRENYEKIFENYTSFNSEISYFSPVKYETMTRVNTNFLPKKYDLSNEIIKNFDIITMNKKFNKINKNNKVFLPTVFLKSNDTTNDITEEKKSMYYKDIKLNNIKKFDLFHNDNDSIYINNKKNENQKMSTNIENNNPNNKNSNLNFTVKKENNNGIFNNVNLNDISKNSCKKNISYSGIINTNNIYPFLNTTLLDQNKNIFPRNNNVKIIDLRKFKTKKLNIHSLSADPKKEKKDIFQKTQDNSTINSKIPVRLPSLNKEIKDYALMNTFRQFKFQLMDRKKIKLFYFRNKIVENNLTNFKKLMKPIKVIDESSKLANADIIKKNSDNKFFDLCFGKSQSSDCMNRIPRK